MLDSEITDERLSMFVSFIKERYSVFAKKEAGEPKPWTQDPILQKYRFCCVHREDDRVTRWITKNWVEPHHDDPDLWFAMVIARHFNLPESMEEIGYPVPFNPDHILAVSARRKVAGQKTYNSAYMIGTNGNPVEKTVYLVDKIFGPLWAGRNTLQPKTGDTLASYHVLLGQFYGLASFLTAQVIADLRQVEPLCSAADWWTFAASGPGSRKGLNVMVERPMDSPWREDNWRTCFSRLHTKITPMLDAAGVPPVHGQNLQNCLCELSKYSKVVQGVGKPKQLYPGA